jgi:RHS repeat-associated protein
MFGGGDAVMGFAPLAVATPDSGGAVVINWIHPNHLGVPLLTLDASGNPAATPNDYLLPGFPGQARVLADLYYNRYRDYDPTTGRYIQADPIGLGGGSNLYGYAGGNPANMIDPDGLQARTLGGILWRFLTVPIIMPSPMSGPDDDAQPIRSNRPPFCELCTETKTRAMAMIQAYAYAGMTGCGSGCEPDVFPIPWDQYRPRSGRDWAEFRKIHPGGQMGHWGPRGRVEEHPVGHMDPPGRKSPWWHLCPHFHATNQEGIEEIFAYKPGT